MIPIFHWFGNKAWQIRLKQGKRGKWRWAIVHEETVVSLSTVKGWDTRDEAKAAARVFLDGIGADYLEVEEG